MNENNIESFIEKPKPVEQSTAVELLNIKTKVIPNNEIKVSSTKRKTYDKSFIIKMISISSLLIGALLFACGLIIYTESVNILKDDSLSLESNSSAEMQSELLIGLPGQGFLLGSRTLTTWTNKTVLQFLGIPYAESPSGIRRFKPPIPKLAWKGVLDASQYGRPCPEMTKLNKTKLSDEKYDVEDCLTLNVFTKDKKLKQPVMVYIHGGGFINGSALEYPPNYLLEKDIVLVVLQYRLGVLGFISTQSDSIPGNAAIHDIILALKWIQKYINFFGGNSNKVTIFGQSSGSAIVTLLSITPVIENHKLFHQVIAQSGSIFAQWAINKNPINSARSACEKICFVQSNYCSSIKNINECLLSANVKDLLKINSNGLSLTFDDKGGILPKLPKELINNVKPKYNVMIGTTKHDGSYVLSVFYDQLMSYKNQNIKPLDLYNLIIKRVNDDDSGIINNLLYKEIFSKKNPINSSFTELIPEFIELCNILYFKSPALTFARMNSPYNNNKTFLYTFDYEGVNTRFGYGASTKHYPFNGGSHHSDDYIYLFPYYFKNLNHNDTEIAKKMVDLWTSFSINGVPTIDETFKLSPMKGIGPYLKINTNITIGNNYIDEFYAVINDPENYKLIKKKEN